MHYKVRTTGFRIRSLTLSVGSVEFWASFHLYQSLFPAYQEELIMSSSQDYRKKKK